MKKRKINYLITIFTLFFGLIVSVNATETNHVVDFTQKGSIKVTLQEEKENTYVSGAKIKLYKVATAYKNGTYIGLKYTQDFSMCEASLDNLENNKLVKNIEKCITENTTGNEMITDINGSVKYNDLDLGLYIIRQENKVKGYSTITPFLTMIPKNINNSWTYDIEATPKTEIYKEIDLTVNKVWNTHNKTHPEQVTIELYKNKEKIDTILLNKKNNWTYTWKDLEKSDQYIIKEVNVPKGYIASYKKEGNTYIVTNTDTLANTGQIYYPIIICVTLGMIFILLGFIESRKED